MPGILGIITSLVPALSQLLTNGGSTLGTLSSPVLPPFLTNNPLPNGFPWGTANVTRTNPYENAPFTGVTRNYDFTISRGKLAPDGVLKDMILVNGQFPAPQITANWGDTISVTVHNNITGPEEGTSLHWHGFLQKDTPYYDGVPSVQQCPIAPGKSFTYTFQADLYGTTWYHSHYSAQYAAGIAGPIVVYGPRHVPYDVDLGPVMLSDWYHKDYFTIVEEVMAPNAGPPPFSDNNLINGKMNFDCSKAGNQTCTPNAGISKFRLTPGKWHRLRIINPSAEGTQQFWIEGYNLTVIANDFVPVKPYTVGSVTVGVGQRTDVLVYGKGKPTDAVWMGSNEVCSTASQPLALAALYYPSADTNALPTVNYTIPAAQCTNGDLSLTTPAFPFGAQPQPATTQTLTVTHGTNSSGNGLFFVNNRTFRGDYNDPVLLDAYLGQQTFPEDYNVLDYGTNTSIRLIVNNEFVAQHPMHLHGHNFFVLASGVGTWDGKITNVNNPQRRDVQILPANGYIVIQFDANNPGVWPFHCHIAWHVSAGLYVNILERPDRITEKQIPSTLAQTCRDWAAFTNTTVPDQIDSGL